MPHDGLPIHQLVGFLGEFAPEQLARLQRAWPGEPVLRQGRLLGELSAPLRIRLDVAEAALRVMAVQADALAQALSQRLRRSHRWEFLAQFVALVGSGGVLTAVIGEADARLKIGSAALALVGSTLALVVKFVRRDLAGAENGLSAQHAELVGAGGSAVELLGRLRPYLHSGDDLDEPAALGKGLEDANALAGRLYALMKRMGANVVPLVFDAGTPAAQKVAS